MTVAFYTLGCKVNSYETMSVKEQFEQQGYTIVEHSEKADVYVINTCTVTNNADAKSRKMIRRMIRKNPEAVVAVMGCYAQIDPETIETIDGVDIIIGTTHRDQLLSHVERFLKQREQFKTITDVSKYRVFDDLNVTHFLDQTRAFIKIQDGCNNFCSYCIIPYARGRVRSRSPEDVIDEAKRLVDNGYKEIVLTGIHTGGYGQDLDTSSFYDLLVRLSRIYGLKRIRISSIEINELTDDIIKLMADNDTFARHLHIPLQSGAHNILKSMRRKYTKEAYLKRINEIRTMLPDIAITTDIIAGYPGETDADFEEMMRFVKEVGFSEMHVFSYSKRNGTPAAKIKEQINGIIKSARVNELMRLSDEMHHAYIKDVNDDVHSVLFESSDEHFTYGHASNYLYIKVNKNLNLHNQLKEVVIIKNTLNGIYGKIIS
ncbi:MAG: tRNA (N(6)-L-threonylcarbamoyladenosine(37)-C(2))-methylthiotransferase MtaB [Candidatus Izemoplasma sp.]|nr:tRNA (N(6)-L-threonylcarbamoyladenosine(37)-C(2))-methylthiotransferase MtaB [Candidatus Izemoplasma sp.]